MIEAIPLETIVYDPRARNGIWCCNPYPGHPKGCPNFPKGCTVKTRPDFNEIKDQYDWYAIIEIFNLADHIQLMRSKHPHWTDRQCRNPLYWQGTVREKLRAKAEYAAGQRNQYRHYLNNENIILDIPEACGINVFETMAKVGVIIEREPRIVRKIMLVGKRRGADYNREMHTGGK